MDPNNLQPQQPVAPQPVQQQVIQTAPAGSALLKILMSILVVAIVSTIICGAYYLGVKKSNVTSNENIVGKPTVTVSVPTLTVTQALSPSPIQSQKSFSSNELGGSFSYPSDWQQNKVSPSNTVDISFTKSLCQKGKDVCFNYYVSIISYPTTISTTQMFVNQYYPGSTSDTVVPTTDYITSNGIDYKKALDQYDVFPDYFTIQNGKVYIISTSISGGLSDTTQKQTQVFLASVQQLLNSFTFHN